MIVTNQRNQSKKKRISVLSTRLVHANPEGLGLGLGVGFRIRVNRLVHAYPEVRVRVRV